MGFDQARTSVMYSAQLESRVFDLGQVERPHLQEFHPIAGPSSDHTVSHNGRSWVYA